MGDQKDVMKTGTTTIGLVCNDGLVLAADRRATVGNFLANKDMDKVYQIADNMVITVAGSVSDVQLLLKLIKAEIRLNQFRIDRAMYVKEVANLLSGMVYSNIRKYSAI